MQGLPVLNRGSFNPADLGVSTQCSVWILNNRSKECQHGKVLGRQASFENFAFMVLNKLEWDRLGNQE